MDNLEIAAQKSSDINHVLRHIYDTVKENRKGALADYIPELAKVDPDKYGLAIVTNNGKIYSVGDVETTFTIQSVSKALNYCIALELLGKDVVIGSVGVEPSGDRFNAIEFDPRTLLPYNPMVNAGAITIAGLIYDHLGDEAYEFILDRFSKAAGRQLQLNEDVYKSELLTGHRNRAIGHLLLSVQAIKEPVDQALDLYFRQCSISVSTIDLAVMAATFANLGQNPITGEQVFDMTAIRNTLSVMFTCGMYDSSGFWAHDVGLPAKSGVGGGILGIVNRQLGIGTYSPLLDANGNSVRGIESFKMLSDEFGLHSFDSTNKGSGLVSHFFDH
jgi:glutaminase